MSAPRHCLLVVDDEVDVLDSVHDLLRREFQVLRARSAAEGCELLQEHEIHIIMTDQRMPHMSGIELLTRARARHPRAVRMLFTGYADINAVIAAINQGHVFRFLQKPWQPEELLEAVREAATEYDRLVEEAELCRRLLSEMQALRERVTALEAEVRQLRGSG